MQPIWFMPAAGRDSPEIWRDDCLELYLDQKGSPDYHFIFNPNGAVFDAIIRDGKEDPGWDCQVRSRAKITDQGWSLDISIPLNDLLDLNALPWALAPM